MSIKKAIRRISREYGKIPDVEYYSGDMKQIRSYYDDCCAEKRDSFYIDDTTWNDLSMDAVYKRINSGLSTAGEQYLYYMLRRPMNKAQFDLQQELITAMESEPETRTKLQKILYRIGSSRRIDISGILHTQHTSPLWLIIYILLAAFLPVSIILAVIFGMPGIWVMIASLIINGSLHELRLQHCRQGITTVNYCVSLVYALKQIQKLKHPKLDQHLSGCYSHLQKLKSVLRIGSVSSATQNDLIAMFMVLFFFDLISFELLKKRLAKYHKEFFAIHEAVGQIDAAISIASFRQSLSVWSVPQIDFTAQDACVHAERVIHPLLDCPVPNDLLLERSLLITGANASGKSTYLKASVLCVLLAQTICTAPAASYRASSFRVYTSMAISDKLLSGESYYVAEIKSLKRILDARADNEHVLCAIDEVLRGTNTIERIAASTEILKSLHRKGILSIVATHDAELCTLVGQEYNQAHFEETITENDILFDYRKKPGMATTRNAINLLKLIGCDAAIVDKAHERANSFVQHGRWDP